MTKCTGSVGRRTWTLDTDAVNDKRPSLRFLRNTTGTPISAVDCPSTGSQSSQQCQDGNYACAADLVKRAPFGPPRSTCPPAPRDLRLFPSFPVPLTPGQSQRHAVSLQLSCRGFSFELQPRPSTFPTPPLPGCPAPHTYPRRWSTPLLQRAISVPPYSFASRLPPLLYQLPERKLYSGTRLRRRNLSLVSQMRCGTPVPEKNHHNHHHHHHHR